MCNQNCFSLQPVNVSWIVYLPLGPRLFEHWRWNMATSLRRRLYSPSWWPIVPKKLIRVWKRQPWLDLLSCASWSLIKTAASGDTSSDKPWKKTYKTDFIHFSFPPPWAQRDVVPLIIFKKSVRIPVTRTTSDRKCLARICTVGNVGNFGLITKSSFFCPKKLIFLNFCAIFGEFSNFRAQKGTKI